jgi:hypothetical protein
VFADIKKLTKPWRVKYVDNWSESDVKDWLDSPECRLSDEQRKALSESLVSNDRNKDPLNGRKLLDMSRDDLKKRGLKEKDAALIKIAGLKSRHIRPRKPTVRRTYKIPAWMTCNIDDWSTHNIRNWFFSPECDLLSVLKRHLKHKVT